MHLAFPPVDVGAMAEPAELADAALRALEDDGCDALVIVFSPPVSTDGAEHADALAEAVTGADKPVTTTFLASAGVPEHLVVPSPPEAGGPDVPARGSVPSYPSPERAVAALARVVRYTQWLARPVGDFVVPRGCDVAAARTLVDGWGPFDTATVLGDEQTDALLRSVGIRVAPFRRARSAQEAVDAAAELGGAAVLKTVVRTWRHRSDLAGVRTGLTDADAVTAAYQQLAQLSGSPEVDVQAQVPPGLPVVVELRDDPSFGSLVSFGLAGVVTELLGDRAYCATPLSTMDAHTLVRAPRAAPLLDGYRGSRPMDLAALEDLLLRVGQLADHVPELRSLALDPVLVAERGAYPTSMRAVLGPPPGPRDHGPRRLGGS
jgi:acyl-CoA synthetase (NDP forming)